MTPRRRARSSERSPLLGALDTPANRRFRAAFEKAYNRIPSFYSENCYTGARILNEAVRAIGGKVEDRPALMAELRKVERVGGKRQNTVIQTYPAVGQFWKYSPEEFLRQPVYARDFPPCRHC